MLIKGCGSLSCSRQVVICCLNRLNMDDLTPSVQFIIITVKAQEKKMKKGLAIAFALFPSLVLADQAIQDGDTSIMVQDGTSASLAAPAVTVNGVQTNIVVDGNPVDWANVPALITDPAGDSSGFPDLVSIKVTNDATHVYFLEEFASAPGNYTYLYMDTDMNAGTGCSAFGLGMEFGITIGATNYIGDARDCAWSDDFGGALTTVTSGNYIESSVPIATLQTITPNMTGFDLAGGNDSTVVGHYQLGASAPVGGSATGVSTSWVLCRNKTTGQSVFIPNAGPSWDCKAAGLSVNPADVIVQTVNGVAN
jgi:hypothetical protein